MLPKVTIVILNWNGWRDTVECLESLYRITYPNYDVVVLDNGSIDGSVEKLRGYCGSSIRTNSKFFTYSSKNKPIEIFYGEPIPDAYRDLPPNKKLILIKNKQNSGFAEGNNIASRYALEYLDPDYLLFLNNDTVVDKDFLSRLVETIESDEDIAFVGPKIYYYDFDGRQDVINVAGIVLVIKKGAFYRIGAGEIDEGQHDQVRTVDYLEGSCMLAKRDALIEIGLFSPRYFAYWEETDLCIRGREAGYRSVYVPGSKIWHKISSSTTGRFKLYYMTRNRFWFLKDHSTKIEFLYFFIYFFSYEFWVSAGAYLRRKDYEKFFCFLKAVVEGLLSEE